MEKATNAPPLSEEKIIIHGTVERITYHNEDNGFCVLRIKAKGFRELVTVVGFASLIASGEFVEAIGSWKNDVQYGLQLAATSLKITPPTTLAGVQKYLSSGSLLSLEQVPQ